MGKAEALNGYAAKTFAAINDTPGLTYTLTAQTCSSCASGEYQPSTGQTSCIPWQECVTRRRKSLTLPAARPTTGIASAKPGILVQLWPFLFHAWITVLRVVREHTRTRQGRPRVTPARLGRTSQIAGQTSCDSAGIGYKVSAEGATLPTACGAGTYQNQKGQTSCTSCPDDSFAAGSGNVRCLPWAICNGDSVTNGDSLTNDATPTATSDRTCKCNAGYSRLVKAEALNGYAAKTFAAINDTPGLTYTLTAQTCSSCASGEYQPSTGQTSCIPWQEVCDAATQVTNFAGSATQNRDCKCKAGYSRATLAVSLSRLDHCTACSAGAYQDLTGQTSCDPCAAGTYQSDPGQTSCDSAGIGYKVSAEGATLPTACGAGTYQNQKGQTSCTSCPDDSFAAGSGNVRCLPWAICNGDSVTNGDSLTNDAYSYCHERPHL